MLTAKETDLEFSDEVLSKVEEYPDGWAISADLGTLFIPKYAGTPKVGDRVRYYGRGLGFPVRGVNIAGIEVYYDTDQGYRAKQKLRQDADNMKRRAEYAEKRNEYTRRINALPGPCQTRLFQFRDRDPDYGWQFEGYELECATIAARIAQAFERRDVPIPADQWFKNWQETDYAVQVSICGPDTGWSGNMMGFAARQAYLLVTNPALVPQEHGALCVLVGCDGFKVCDSHRKKHAS